MRCLLALTFLTLPLATPVRRAAAQCTGAARQAFQDRRFDDARGAARAQLEQSSGDATALYCMGRVSMAQNRTGEAVDWFEKAVKADARSSEYHLWLGNALGEEAQRANKFRQPLLARRVKTEFERAVELDPSSVDARHGLIQFYSVAPGIMGGSMEKAKAQATEIGKLNMMRGHLELAALLEREKNLAAAERELVASVESAPDSSAGQYALGSFYTRRRRWNDAFGIYDRLLTAKPDEFAARFMYGRTAALSGENLERGERELKALLADPPKDFPPASFSATHLRLGNIYEKQGRSDLARTEYAEAVKQNPKNEDAKKALSAIR